MMLMIGLIPASSLTRRIMVFRKL